MVEAAGAQRRLTRCSPFWKLWVLRLPLWKVTPRCPVMCCDDVMSCAVKMRSRGRREEKEKEEEKRRVSSKKLEPHTEMWGKRKQTLSCFNKIVSIQSPDSCPKGSWWRKQKDAWQRQATVRMPQEMSHAVVHLIWTHADDTTASTTGVCRAASFFVSATASNRFLSHDSFALKPGRYKCSACTSSVKKIFCFASNMYSNDPWAACEHLLSSLARITWSRPERCVGNEPSAGMSSRLSTQRLALSIQYSRTATAPWPSDWITLLRTAAHFPNAFAARTTPRLLLAQYHGVLPCPSTAFGSALAATSSGMISAQPLAAAVPTNPQPGRLPRSAAAPAPPPPDLLQLSSAGRSDDASTNWLADRSVAGATPRPPSRCCALQMPWPSSGASPRIQSSTRQVSPHKVSGGDKFESQCHDTRFIVRRNLHVSAFEVPP